MGKNKKLSDGELELMEVLWQKDAVYTTGEIMELLKGHKEWTLSTVMTMLSRLCEKGYLVCDRTTRINKYSTLISKDAYGAKEGKGIIEKLYSNSFGKMVTALYNHKALDENDIEDLRRFLDELEGRE